MFFVVHDFVRGVEDCQDLAPGAKHRGSKMMDFWGYDGGRWRINQDYGEFMDNTIITSKIAIYFGLYGDFMV